jgi:thiamine biosynthesis lipoprotein
MGTTYHVTYVLAAGVSPPSEKAVESLLQDINQSVSTYIPSSAISQLNNSRNPGELHPADRHFAAVFERSREIYSATHGAFNPAVAPLVNAWGFGPTQPEVLPDDAAIKRLLPTVSLEAFTLQKSPPAIRKQLAESQLDFGGIAKGYAVDAVAALLDQAHIENYLVELAGEVRARGSHPDGKAWRVGIERPAENALATEKIQTIVELDNRGMSTSGNYRNFEAADGKTYGHILDPRTGYPVSNSLVSATVLAPDTMTADAYATAMIVMGFDEAIKLVEGHPELSAYFIVMDENARLVAKRSSRFPL